MKNSSKNTDLVLFVSNISKFTENKLNGGGVRLEPFVEEIKDAPPATNRWKVFLDYVNKHISEYSQILISDTRDVIFQDDVFKNFIQCGNYLGTVIEGDNIRGEKTGDNDNYRWIRDILGKSEADKLADKPIICCGTVI